METNKEFFEEAIRLWTEWNSGINVISRKDIDNVYEHHILHSLTIAQYRPFEAGEKVLDLGTGGGFPGIPLAMVSPQADFTLCDSIGKKITVARAVSDALGLKNVTCVNARAESLPQTYDWIVSRAVTSLDNFYPWVKGKFRKGILYLKGGDVNSEIADFCRKFSYDPAKVCAVPLSRWLSDEYFSEKFVIDIRK
ncbi:MAG: 16S rRNA (guanine(527)-N(7))-methyltransferase RsmG [Bacteroidales bacterium]|nr:16S rRNA (guanine(527)-N(7))-methyltransferase RsmG [Bacteroidales bacterium]